MRKGKIVFIGMVAALFIFFLWSYVYYINIKVSNTYADAFRRDLIKAIQQGSEFDMMDVTPFDWDRMIVFNPYTSREEMERVVGREWTTYSYLGFVLIQKTEFGKYPLVDDSLNKLVFMKGDQVVLDLTFNRGVADFTHIEGNISPGESRFVAEDHILKSPS